MDSELHLPDDVERHALEGTLIEPSERSPSTPQPGLATLEELASQQPEIERLLYATDLVPQLETVGRDLGVALSELSLNVQIPEELIEQLFERLVERFEQRVTEGRSSEEQWLTLKQAAAHMSCSINHIYKLRSDGRLPKHGSGTRKGRQLKSELDAYLRADSK
jgi:excisionase family DNA binding protein